MIPPPALCTYPVAHLLTHRPPFPLPFPSPHLQKHKKTVNAAKDLVGVLQNLDRTDDAKKCAEEFGL